MKVLAVTTEYGNGATGGIETSVNFLIQAILERTDWEIDVASLRMSRRAEESRRLLDPRSWWRRPRISTQTVGGIRIHQIGCAFAELEMSRFLPRKWLDRLMSDFDAIVVVSGSPAVANAVRRADAPVALQVATLVEFERKDKNSRMRGLIGFYRRATTRLTARLDESGLTVPSVVLVMNNVMLAECERRGVKDVELCHPGVDTSVFFPKRQENSAPYILMVARLGDPRKNLGELLRSYARARSVGGVTHDLVLAGMTPPGAADLELIDELGLGGSVHIQSPVSHADLVELYQGADVFASASFEEGFGLTFLEAMACAVPVVTTNSAGATFILDGSSGGAIVPFGDGLTERFASELSRLCLDETLRSAASAAALQRVCSTFSNDVTSRRLVEAVAGLKTVG